MPPFSEKEKGVGLSAVAFFSEKEKKSFNKASIPHAKKIRIKLNFNITKNFYRLQFVIYGIKNNCGKQMYFPLRHSTQVFKRGV